MAAALLALQFLVQVSGLPCAISDMSRAGSPSAEMMAMHMGTGAAEHTRQHAPRLDESPCGSPTAPAACQAMVACAPAIVAPVTVALTPPAALADRPAALAVLAPPLLKTAPELPPPRA